MSCSDTSKLNRLECLFGLARACGAFWCCCCRTQKTFAEDERRAAGKYLKRLHMQEALLGGAGAAAAGIGGGAPVVGRAIRGAPVVGIDHIERISAAKSQENAFDVVDPLVLREKRRVLSALGQVFVAADNKSFVAGAGDYGETGAPAESKKQSTSAKNGPQEQEEQQKQVTTEVIKVTDDLFDITSLMGDDEQERLQAIEAGEDEHTVTAVAVGRVGPLSSQNDPPPELLRKAGEPGQDGPPAARGRDRRQDRQPKAPRAAGASSHRTKPATNPKATTQPPMWSENHSRQDFLDSQFVCLNGVHKIYPGAEVDHAGGEVGGEVDEDHAGGGGQDSSRDAVMVKNEVGGLGKINSYRWGVVVLRSLGGDPHSVLYPQISTQNPVISGPGLLLNSRCRSLP